MSSTVIVMSKQNKILCQRQSDKVGNIRVGGSTPTRYEIFGYYSKIAEHIGDVNWINFFDVMSKGSFWRGIKFDGSQLITKKKNVIKTHLVMVSGEMNIETDLENDLVHYNECKEFIKNNSSHFALKESESVRMTAETIEPVKSGFENSLTKQSIYINEFAIRKVREFGLDESYVTCIVSSIFAKLSNKSITPKSFTFSEEGTISGISGFEIDSTGYRFDENIASPVQKRSKRDSENFIEKRPSFRCSKNLSMCVKNTPKNHL